MSTTKIDADVKLPGTSFAGWWKCFVAACFLLVLFAGNTLAGPITVPTGLGLGDEYRLVFVTSTTRAATSTDIAYYNDFVTDVANQVPALVALGTTWTAIGSTSAVDARDNTDTNTPGGVPIYRLDDTRVADNNDALWGTFSDPLLASINVNQWGMITPNFAVWTGTNDLGFAYRPLGSGQVEIGSTTAVTEAWIESGSQTNPGMPRVFYAMSGIVPEPASLCLLSLGALVLTRRRRGICGGRRCFPFSLPATRYSPRA